ncbi:hypothetical protein V6N13_113587 [Hibiscus sabdariffa]|uniref:E3 ubiquitin protein ligase n=1 Tax=Hibiscus sabdariffa TaxID=183260 RepID=A0ABR2TZV7_9ROSI
MKSFESEEEPEKMRPHLDSPTSPNHAKSVDAAVLQYQNQKLVQQLDIQKNELHDLETKIKELKDKQTSYDDMLITVNQLWNQLVDDMVLLGIRVGGGHNALQLLDHADNSRDTKIDDMMKEEARNLHEMIRALHMKHKEYVDGIQTYISSHSTDQSEIKRLQGELEEIMAELEESRRKLVGLKMQKNIASGMHASTPVVANGSLSPEKPADKTMGLREIKDLIEETKIVASDRLSELQDAQEQYLIFSKQLKDLQNELKDDKFIQSSRLYTLLNDQLQHWNAEMEQYKALSDALQTDRLLVMRREKELNMKAESADSVRNTIDNAGSRIEELNL